MQSTALTRSFFVSLVAVCTITFATTPTLAAAQPTTSYVFTVNTTKDTHDAHPGDGKCADKMGRCSLRAATEEADALPKGSHITITVPAGTDALTLGTLYLKGQRSVTITGASSKTTMIKGNHAFGIISISRNVSASLNQITIEGGQSSNNGGGISNDGTLTVSHSTLSGNKASFGGGIYNDTNGTVSVSDSILSGNKADHGGGIANGTYNNPSGTVNVRTSFLSGNSGYYDSGGIYNNGTLNLSDSTLDNNSAGGLGGDGGGLYNDGTARVSNSTISDNSANHGQGMGYGGGISNNGTLSVSDSTISDNYADQAGGGIDNYGTVTLTSTIVANNQGGNCDAPPTETVGYNLDSGTSCGFHLHTDLKKTDPKLGPLQDNGGPTPTIALLQGSKAIDWVKLSSCPSTDQRGYTRPDDQSEHACDIGAYESAYEISKGGMRDRTIPPTALSSGKDEACRCS